MSVIYKYLQELKHNQNKSPDKEVGPSDKGRFKRNKRSNLFYFFMIFCVGLFCLIGGMIILLIKNGYLFPGYNKSTDYLQKVSSRVLIKKLESAMNPSNTPSSKVKKSSIHFHSLSAKKKEYALFIENLKKEAQKRLEETLKAKKIHSTTLSSQKPRGKKHVVSSLQKRRYLEKEFRRHFISLSKKNEEISRIQKTLQTLVIEKDLKRALKLLPRLERLVGKENPLVLKWRGVILLQEGNYREAEKIFLKVISLSPEDSGSYVNLILTFLHEGKYNQARLYYAIFQNRFPDSPFLSKLTSLF